MFDNLKKKVEIKKRKKEWRRRNSNNYTYMVNDFDIELVSVGDYSYGGIIAWSANKLNKLKIGNYCSIAEGVKFILNADHPVNYLSTYPFKTMMLNDGLEAISKGDIVVDDDVWFGGDAIIMSGVHIGKGAVVAAGAVVTKDVPPYAIVGGVPAKVIKYRFDERIIEKLMKFDYNKLTVDKVRKNKELFYQEMTEDVADNLLEIFGDNNQKNS